MEYIYIFILIGIIGGLILWVNYLGRLGKRLKLKNKFHKTGVAGMNGIDFEDSNDSSKGNQFSEVNNDLLILITKLKCADLIIPDVEFESDDSIELIQLKKEVMKVKKLLGGLVNR